jgi:sirohydrochlorin cobaltochelatase
LIVETLVSTGILLIGHGTRDAAGVREFLHLGELLVAQAAPMPVSSCFLELAEPSIAVGVERLLKSGVRRILVAPLLLFSAGHHQRDVPEAVSAALAAHPEIETAQLPALNDHPQVLALSQRRLSEARRVDNAAPEAKPGNRLLLLVGRGSSDAAASARLRDFAAQRAVAAGVQSVLSCFVHGQVPSLTEGLKLAAAASASTILVQPHLLFQGLVYQEIEAAVQRIAATSDKAWRLAAPLGPDPDIAHAVLELAAPRL